MSLFKKKEQKSVEVQEEKVEEVVEAEVINADANVDNTVLAPIPEEEKEPMVIDSIQSLMDSDCRVIIDLSYGKEVVLKPFADESGIYFPDIINTGTNCDILYRCIPSEIIEEYIRLRNNTEKEVLEDENRISEDAKE